jgi:hypothetical protein
MSYDYFLQAHFQEEPQNIPTEAILAIFAPFTKEKGEEFIDLEFGEGNSCTIYITTTDVAVSGFSVNRPCDSRQLGECLYRVMSLGNFVFFEPDGKQPIILDSAIEGHLPGDMVEALGKPAVAGSEEDFLAFYFNKR